jgi:predicted Ser/Thr protein kinase
LIVAGTVRESFGAYDIQREVGRGGMGVVYLATDRRLSRRVALKVIVPELAADAQFRVRFEREARVAATLEHPHVVPVYEAGEHDGSLFIAMRFIDGSDLASDVRQRGPVAPPRFARIVVHVAGALDAAHRAGVVHRDVKPANVLLTGEGDDEQAYLTDFGLTREAADSGLTATGQWVGTVDYAAPEQIMGEPTDARTDVYALGCTAFHALTGQPPFEGVSAARLFAHMNNPPPSACDARAGLRPEVDAAIARAMAKEPGERFPSAGDFARAMAAALTGETNLAPERTVAAGPALTGVPQVHEPAAATRLAPTAVAPAPRDAPTAAAPLPAPSPARRGRQPRVLAAVALILVVAAAAVVAMLAGGGDKSYADQAGDAVADLSRANRTLSARLADLDGGTPHATIEQATAATASAQRAARRRVASLNAGEDGALAARLTRALDAEGAFLDQAAKAAAAPSSADAQAIQSAGDRMTGAFAAVEGDVSGLASVDGAAKLADWVRARQGGARVVAFVRGVDGILAQARPGRRRISQVAGAIQNGSITASDARSGIDDVVTNRQAALASARALPAPDDTAGDIKNKLVEAFRRSLDNDRDFQDGVAAYESGDFARFATKVYDDAFASNDAATTAKKAFLDAYNALRAKRGLAPVADDF